MIWAIGILIAALALTRLEILAANADMPMFTSQSVREIDVEAAQTIYLGALVGRHYATGYLRPLEVCDEFVGIASEKCDNSSGSNGDKSCKFYSQGDFVLALTGVGLADVGRAVYATADDAIAFTGHALAYVGRVVGVDSTNKAIVRLKQPGELPTPADDGTMLCRGGPWAKATGNNAAAAEWIDGDGCIVSSALGLGVIPANDNCEQLSLDNTDEASDASVMTYAKFDLDAGVVLEWRLAAYSVSGTEMTGANVDLDFGLADAVVKTAVDPTRHVRFHIDGGGTTLMLGADDDTTDVAETDTTEELAKTLATAQHFVIIVRKDGSVEAYLDGVLLTTPSLALIDMSSGGDVCGFVNVEKTSAAGIAIVEIPKFAVYGGR